MKHFKQYYQPINSTLEPDIEADMDDLRTMASLIKALDGGRPNLPHDGNNEDNPYQTLPVERWSRMASWKERS